MRSRKPVNNVLRSGRVRVVVTIAVVTLLLSSSGSAQDQISPGKNIETVGVPAIPASIAREVSPYSGLYGLPLAGWDLQKREIWLKGLSSVTWISRVGSPGATPETSSIYIRA